MKLELLLRFPNLVPARLIHTLKALVVAISRHEFGEQLDLQPTLIESVRGTPDEPSKHEFFQQSFY